MTNARITPPLKEFCDLARQGNLIPLIVDLVADAETPISAFAKIDEGPCFLFESAENSEASGRFSFIGFDPLLLFQSIGTTISITEEGATRSFETKTDPLTELQTAMSPFQFSAGRDLPHFLAGAVGFLGYDVVQFFEPRVGLPPPDDLQLPDMLFMIARTFIVFDHRFRRLRLVSNAYVKEAANAEQAYAEAQGRLERALERLKRPIRLRPISADPIREVPRHQSNISRDAYQASVLQAKEFIGAGDIFQTVLSQRFETEFSGDPLDLYRCLRFGNPSPYMFCLKFPDFTAVGSSPEMHVRVRAGLAEIRPIAGTRPRGADSAEDDRLAAELLGDPKERAEHVMLIDLGRNDLGRIAQFGSVCVTEQMVIERYSHVMHIASHVTARLRDNRNGFDAIRATFPAGTVSGAPKVRAMQIINSLETSRRGFYAGIVGYFGFDGSVDSCISLRSIVLKNGKAYLQTGAGIVADSDPAREYDECVNKARAMLEAVARAGRIEQ
jgi:anthranilate synthase component 1